MPTTDTTQNVVSSISSNAAGVVTMRTTRKLTTGDPTDFVVPLDTPFGFAWATNTNTQALQYHGSANKKSMQVMLPSDGTPMKIYESSSAFYYAVSASIATIALALF
mgnify:CR=1 FL=1